MIPKAEVDARDEISFSWTMQYLPPPGFTDLGYPSAMMLENGSICMFLKMRDGSTPDPAGLYFTRYNGTTWTAPDRLTSIYEKRVQNNYVLRFNATHLIAIWMENYNATAPSINFSLVYRFSLDNGTSWMPKKYLFHNCTNHFNAFQRRDGKFVFSMLFDTKYRAEIEIATEYFFVVPDELGDLPSMIPQRVFPNLDRNGHDNIAFFVDSFPSGDIISSRGDSITITYVSRNEVSAPYTMFETIPYAIVGLRVIDDETAMCFVQTGNQCGFKYLTNFYLVVDGGLTPEQIFLIVVIVIILAQVLLYMLHKRKTRAKNAARGDVGGSGQPRNEVVPSTSQDGDSASARETGKKNPHG